MFDAKRLLDQLVGSGAAGGFAGGLAGGVLANVLSGKKGRKIAGSALKLGGVALVGGLAYKAWQNYQQQQPGPGTGAGAGAGDFTPPANSAAEQKLSLLLTRSMISAAKADGQIDTEESQRILNEINRLQLDPDDKAFLFEAYSQPLDIQGLAADVNSPAEAAEVYAAALLMLDNPTPPERIYLQSLAGALGLEPALVETTIESNRPG